MEAIYTIRIRIDDMRKAEDLFKQLSRLLEESELDYTIRMTTIVQVSSQLKLWRRLFGLQPNIRDILGTRE